MTERKKPTPFQQHRTEFKDMQTDVKDIQDLLHQLTKQPPATTHSPAVSVYRLRNNTAQDPTNFVPISAAAPDGWAVFAETTGDGLILINTHNLHQAAARYGGGNIPAEAVDHKEFRVPGLQVLPSG